MQGAVLALVVRQSNTNLHRSKGTAPHLESQNRTLVSVLLRHGRGGGAYFTVVLAATKGSVKKGTGLVANDNPSTSLMATSFELQVETDWGVGVLAHGRVVGAGFVVQGYLAHNKMQPPPGPP